MAAIQPFVNLQPFKGTEKENLNEFIRQLESCIAIAGIADADRHRYLHLHLKGGALTFFDQLDAAVRNAYDDGVAALRERYQNDQRIQLQKLVFSARKLKPSEESAQDFLTDLQRLALEAFPDIAARAAAGGRPAVVAENRAHERARRVRESFIQGMPIKLRRFLMTLPEETTIDDLCAKAASRMIVDRLYPEDDDSAFNEISSTSVSTKELLTGMQALSLAQDTLKQQTNKLSDELQQLNKNLQPSLNLINQQNTQNTQQDTRQNNQQQNRQNNYQNNNRNNNNQNYKRNYNNNNGRQNNNRNNNYNNKGKNNWQNRGQNNQNRNNAQSSRKYCNYCNKFGHTIAVCWHRQSTPHPPALPYQQYSTYAFQQSQQHPPQMTNPMIPTYNPVTQPWLPYYDANMNQKN